MIGWRDERGEEHRGTLFAAFAALARGDAWSFPALRPHQREPWHAFTVQVAAMALIHAGLNMLPTDEAAWRDLLLGLTPDYPDGEAWELVVDDWAKPALLQPPVVAMTDKAAYKNRLPTPDALDMLVTAKNHDVKQARMIGAGEEDWLFALVALQTTEGFLGAGNYGISRMNGGFATRMSLGVRPGGGAGHGFARDVIRLVQHAATRTEPHGAIGLLWTVPWDGTASLDIEDLDPLYVEICRRVRLRHDTAGAIEALAAGSKCARVAAAELKGRTGDPWAPMKADGSTSHTPTGAGFGYRQMANLLDEKKIAAPLLAQWHDGDDRDGLTIIAAALVRGQGKTEGLHRRRVRISRMERIGNYDLAPLDRIGAVARERADEAGEAGRKLRRALISLVQGGPEQARFDDDAAKRKTQRWLDRFDTIVDAEFFDTPFWEEAAGQDPHPRRSWRTRLEVIARKVFDAAAESAPGTEVRRIRARARARSLLDDEISQWLKGV